MVRPAVKALVAGVSLLLLSACGGPEPLADAYDAPGASSSELVDLSLYDIEAELDPFGGRDSVPPVMNPGS